MTLIVRVENAGGPPRESSIVINPRQVSLCSREDFAKRYLYPMLSQLLPSLTKRADVL